MARKKGLVSASELFEAMKGAGYPISLGGVRKHWYGKHAPAAAAAVDYCEFLDMSLDYYLQGKTREKLSVKELKQIVGEMIVDAGGEVPVNDPTIAEVVRLMAKIETPDQRQMVIRVVKSIVGES